MTVRDAIEQAYRNGYEAGVKDSVVHGRWVFGTANHREYMKCSVCVLNPKHQQAFSHTAPTVVQRWMVTLNECMYESSCRT